MEPVTVPCGAVVVLPFNFNYSLRSIDRTEIEVHVPIV